MPNVGLLELVVFVVVVLAPAGVVAPVVWLVRRLSGGSQSRVQTLEARMRELEERKP